MGTTFAPGRYRVQITDQNFIQSSVKQTLGFTLGFRVLSSVDRPEEPVSPTRRDLTLWVTNRNFKLVMRNLRDLGYEGESLIGVDPDQENFHSFRGLEVDLDCTHETNTRNEVFERWELISNKPRLEDKSLIHHFDRLLNPKSKAEPEPEDAIVGVTEDDVPF